ncbi:MAG: oligosaccharide flippase family protein [Rhodanobacter sp.]
MRLRFLTGGLDSLMERLGIGRLGQNALMSTAGLGTRAVIQAAYLIVLSRWMGPHGYGLFAGSVAVAIIISLVSGWGISYVVTQRVARDPTRSNALWATAILQVLLSGALLVGVLMLGSSVVLVERVDIRSMLLLGLAELMALPLVQVATSLCLALDRGASAAVSMCLVPVFRLLAMIVALAAGLAGTPDHVAFLHFAGSIVGMLVAIYLITRIDGAPAWRDRLPWWNATAEGTRYAVGSLVGTSYQEVDKVLLLQILGATVVGTYTAAFRVMSVFVLPVAALMGAALPRLFASNGRHSHSRLLKTVTLAAVGYAIAASIVAALVSPLMPFVFGSGYEVSTRYLLMLSPWAIVFALHQSAAIGLTSADRHGARVVVESLGLVMVVGINLWLLRTVGVGAAVLALLVAEIFMASGCWLLLKRH